MGLQTTVATFIHFPPKINIIVRFLDSSCGDMHWMPTFLNNRTDVIFTGYDITDSNIQKHKETFKDKEWNFKVIQQPT